MVDLERLCRKLVSQVDDFIIKPSGEELLGADPFVDSGTKEMGVGRKVVGHCIDNM